MRKKFGFDKPAAVVRMGTGSSQATLTIGGAAEEGTVYAKDHSRPAVFTVESSVLDELKKDPSEYRQKDLFDARSFNATRVEIVRGGQTHAFEKAKVKNKEGQDEEKWRQTSPQTRELDQASFDSLLSAVTGTRATSFVDAAAAAKALAAPEIDRRDQVRGREEGRTRDLRKVRHRRLRRARRRGRCREDRSEHGRLHRQGAAGDQITFAAIARALLLTLAAGCASHPVAARQRGTARLPPIPPRANARTRRSRTAPSASCDGTSRRCSAQRSCPTHNGGSSSDRSTPASSCTSSIPTSS